MSKESEQKTESPVETPAADKTKPAKGESKTVNTDAETKSWSEWSTTIGVPAPIWKGAIAHLKADPDAPVTRSTFESAIRTFAGSRVQ